MIKQQKNYNFRSRKCILCMTRQIEDIACFEFHTYIKLQWKIDFGDLYNTDKVNTNKLITRQLNENVTNRQQKYSSHIVHVTTPNPDRIILYLICTWKAGNHLARHTLKLRRNLRRLRHLKYCNSPLSIL